MYSTVTRNKSELHKSGIVCEARRYKCDLLNDTQPVNHVLLPVVSCAYLFRVIVFLLLFLAW